MNKTLKVKIKSTKLSTNPLFIKFLNWTGDKFTIEELLKGICSSFESEEDKKIVNSLYPNMNEDFYKNLEDFKIKFKTYLSKAILANSTSEEFLLWLSNSFKYISEEVILNHKDETRKVHIKDPAGRWLEAIICYNFIMTFNNFGIDVIKQCPVCSRFFSHKGKYARYCSDDCKAKGMKKC